ncbi:MAG: helix-turn-helix transcriptional regulator [Thermoplasmata archaeon]
MTESSDRNNMIMAGLVASVIIIVVGITLALWDTGGMATGMWSHHGIGVAFPMAMFFMVFGFVLLVLFLILILSQPSGVQRPVEPYVPIAPYQRSEDWTPEMQNLALKLLPGGESRMLRLIFDAGGQILQKDLVDRGAFSKAKVTRLLDKLEHRGLIVRERRGSTNLVRVLKNLGSGSDGISEK